jgi:hypothetical protein
MEENCKYVSSRGILKSCDMYSLTPVSSIPNLINYNENMFASKNNGVVYICNSAIREFCNYYRIMKCKIILVSGDSDTTVPYDIFSSEKEFFDFIESDNIIHWFSQNCVIKHPKISQIPIGLDYHTLANQDYKWGAKQLPINQEETLVNIKNNAQPFWNRNLQCYSNFHFNFYKFGQDRIDAISKIPHNLIYYENVEVPRVESWKKQSTFAFVVSPHGNGLDCHRTWEALVLGCIAIVKKSALDTLYEGLPVLIVNDWSDITVELLRSTVDDYKTRTFNYDKLTLDYWLKIIKRKMI